MLLRRCLIVWLQRQLYLHGVALLSVYLFIDILSKRCRFYYTSFFIVVTLHDVYYMHITSVTVILIFELVIFLLPRPLIIRLRRLFYLYGVASFYII